MMKFIKIKPTLATPRPIIQGLRCLALKILLLANSSTKGIKVKIAGYILKASKNCPSKSSNTDRCNPHPGHSRPNNSLLRHGNI